jgi:hypothetical protein
MHDRQQKAPHDEVWAADLLRQGDVPHDLRHAPINGIVRISS